MKRPTTTAHNVYIYIYIYYDGRLFLHKQLFPATQVSGHIQLPQTQQTRHMDTMLSATLAQHCIHVSCLLGNDQGYPDKGSLFF